MENQREYNFIFWNSSVHKRKHNITVPADPVSIIRQPEVLVLFFLCPRTHVLSPSSQRYRHTEGKHEDKCFSIPPSWPTERNCTAHRLNPTWFDTPTTQHNPGELIFSTEMCSAHRPRSLGHATWNRRRLLVRGLQFKVTNTCPFYITHHIMCRYKGPSTGRTSSGRRPLGF